METKIVVTRQGKTIGEWDHEIEYGWIGYYDYTSFDKWQSSMKKCTDYYDESPIESMFDWKKGNDMKTTKLLINKNREKDVPIVFEVQYGHDQIIDHLMDEFDKMSEDEKEEWHQRIRNYKKQ